MWWPSKLSSILVGKPESTLSCCRCMWILNIRIYVYICIHVCMCCTSLCSLQRDLPVQNCMQLYQMLENITIICGWSCQQKKRSYEWWPRGLVGNGLELSNFRFAGNMKQVVEENGGELLRDYSCSCNRDALVFTACSVHWFLSVSNKYGQYHFFQLFSSKFCTTLLWSIYISDSKCSLLVWSNSYFLRFLKGKWQILFLHTQTLQNADVCVNISICRMHFASIFTRLFFPLRSWHSYPTITCAIPTLYHSFKTFL